MRDGFELNDIVEGDIGAWDIPRARELVKTAEALPSASSASSPSSEEESRSSMALGCDWI
jgi:hypothetical protein